MHAGKDVQVGVETASSLSQGWGCCLWGNNVVFVAGRGPELGAILWRPELLSLGQQRWREYHAKLGAIVLWAAPSPRGLCCHLWENSVMFEVTVWS
jgi:hypothetical protein